MEQQVTFRKTRFLPGRYGWFGALLGHAKTNNYRKMQP